MVDPILEAFSNLLGIGDLSFCKKRQLPGGFPHECSPIGEEAASRGSPHSGFPQERSPEGGVAGTGHIACVALEYCDYVT
eukprot:8886110-Heterocapsa_arctica.AAC.1